MTKAECRGVLPKKPGDPDLFFPERGEVALAFQAQMICMSCPVLQQCKEYQARMKNQYGIWAAKRESPG
jgi:hypothetical protein